MNSTLESSGLSNLNNRRKFSSIGSSWAISLMSIFPSLLSSYTSMNVPFKSSNTSSDTLKIFLLNVKALNERLTCMLSSELTEAINSFKNAFNSSPSMNPFPAQHKSMMETETEKEILGMD